jgi:hypothetical protein
MLGAVDQRVRTLVAQPMSRLGDWKANLMPSNTPARQEYRPLYPEAFDQGDPYALVLPIEVSAPFRYYAYCTGEDPIDGHAFPVYGSRDLADWERLGDSLVVEEDAAHWAPCVRYVSELERPYVMLYSRAVGLDDLAHVGHALRRADSAFPEGPFHDTGPVDMPAYDFAIDPDVYWTPNGELKLAFAVDFIEDEPFGTGLVEASIAPDLRKVTSVPRLLARPRSAWHVYDPARTMPWKSITGVDWATQTVRWHTMEAPVGGLVSPTGQQVYLYSGGSFSNFYAVGALIEESGQLRDVTHGTTGFVLQPDPERVFFAPGHCSWLRALDGTDYLLFHARFGALTAKRQMALARLRWDANGLPHGLPVS